MIRKKNREAVIIALVVMSLIVALLSPKDQVIDALSNQWSYLLIILVATEGLFLAGLAIMIVVLGYDLGPNVFLWRKHLNSALHEIPQQNSFWIGFWVNAVGAVGTGLVVLFTVITILPVQAWGLSLIAVLDISITLSLRYEILRMAKDESIKTKHN